MGGYELLEVIGFGGMGEVWRAHDTRLARDVALKTLPSRLADDAASVARLTREARLLAALNHPNIAAILGLEEHEGSIWLVLELVDGITLDDRLRSGRLALEDAIRIVLQIADALQAAHSRGIVHCDLKPANVKVADGRVKVLDFGIARSVRAPADAQQETLTAQPDALATAGTPAYMSPEQVRGEAVGPVTDIWACGVLLYRMLAGRLPFEGTTVADTFAQILQSEPDVSSLPPDVPEGVVRVLLRCLDKDPRRRIQSAADLRLFIEDALLPQPKRGRMRAIRRAAAVVVAAALLAGGLGWYVHDRPAARGPASAQRSGDPSIVVLPFVNLDADPTQEYFSDGLSEELINQLAQVEGLKVIARTSAFSFKGRLLDLRDVGETLGVAHILEGSVRKSNGRIRVTAQLINATTGYHLWSESFDRSVSDVFAIQDEIASTVTRKLLPTLGLPDRTVDQGGTRNVQAYDHLLRGIADFARQTPQAFDAAIAQFRQALAMDPDYARAAAELIITMGARGSNASEKARFGPEREAALRTAQRVAPDAPLTQVATMWIHSDRHEWIEADAACAKVFADGSDPRAEGICGGFLTLTGRVRAALPYREAFRSSDPLSMAAAHALARHYVHLGMEPALKRELSRMEALPGAAGYGDEILLIHMAASGPARQELEAQLDRICNTPRVARCQAWTAAIRNPQQAPALLRAQLRESGEAFPDDTAAIAMAAAYLGETSLALEALQLFTARAGSASFQILWFPLMQEVRKDPGFKRIVLDLGLVELWQRGGWADACRPAGTGDFECN